jgi:hypothetical protein
MDHTTMRNELALRHAINRQFDEIVQLATRTVVEHINLKEMEKSQLRNLINVATSAESVEVVTNFIRYQIARNEKKAWRGDHDFGHEVINVIDGRLKAIAYEHVVDAMKEELARRNIGQEDIATIDMEAIKKLTHQRLTVLYLGYLNRCFYYVKDTKTDTTRDLPSGMDLLRKVMEVADARYQ